MRARTLAVVAATLLAVTACSSGQEPAPTPAPSSSTPSEPVIAPLTGEEVDAADWPALAAKIDDHPDALPQVGLELADIVFEELVEGGITRYVAVWHSEIPEIIGPVRSIRPMDPAIVAPFGGAVVYSGGQDRFVQAMEATDVVNVVHGGELDAYFHRASDRETPHDVLVDAAALVDDELSDLAPPEPQLDYADGPSTAEQEGVPSTSAQLAFSPAQTPSWTCDEASGQWSRAQQGGPDLDAQGGQLSASNVVVLRVDVLDDQDVPSTQLVGSGGSGVVLSGCASIEVTWSKGELDDPIVLETLDGAPVEVSTGSTWFELVPSTGSVDVA